MATQKHETSEQSNDSELLAEVRRLGKLIAAGGLSKRVRNDLAWFRGMVARRVSNITSTFSASATKGEIIACMRNREEFSEDDRRKEAAWMALDMAMDAAAQSSTAEGAIAWGPRIGAACAAVEEAIGIGGMPGKAGKKKRHNRQTSIERTPTEKQLEAVQIVGECKGSFSDAARRLGKNRKTVEQHYKAGMRNAGSLASALTQKHRTQQLPHDGRGQVAIADDDNE
jgi:hypothetical protein